jgi:anti-sigma B factor antagonist
MDDQPDDLTVDFTIDSSIDGDTAVIRITGEIDIASREALTNAAQQAIAAGASRIILDMSEVTFMDSSGISAVITAQAIAPLTLRNPSDAVQRLIAATGLTDTVTVEP